MSTLAYPDIAPLPALRAPDAAPAIVIDTATGHIRLDATAGAYPVLRGAAQVRFVVRMGEDTPEDITAADAEAFVDAVAPLAAQLVHAPDELVLRERVVTVIRLAWDRYDLARANTIEPVTARSLARRYAREQGAALAVAEHAVAIHDPAAHGRWGIKLVTADDCSRLVLTHPTHGEHSEALTLTWRDAGVAGDIAHTLAGLLTEAQATTSRLDVHRGRRGAHDAALEKVAGAWDALRGEGGTARRTRTKERAEFLAVLRWAVDEERVVQRDIAAVLGVQPARVNQLLMEARRSAP